MRPVEPNAPTCLIRRGDWFVVPWDRIEQQDFCIDAELMEEVDEIVVADALPLRTVRGFYGTSTGVALEHHRGPRVAVTIYRAKHDFMPRSLP
jgi:hypothetical protein